MYELMIKKFENALANIQLKVSIGEPYSVAKIEIEKLLAEANETKSCLLNNGIRADVMVELIAIINQISQYREDLIDLIEIQNIKTV